MEIRQCRTRATSEKGRRTPEVARLLTDPVLRRSWLLAKALETHPLDEALELARSAEVFITASPVPEAGGVPLLLPGEQATIATRDPGESRPKVLTPRSPLTLSPEKREQLLERLAEGARNAELARDFGLTPKQVQGIRMGSAREIARRRDRTGEHGR